MSERLSLDPITIRHSQMGGVPGIAGGGLLAS